MTRKKKTRNLNESNPKHSPRTKQSERVVSSKKTDTGNKTGSRYQEVALSTKLANKAKDPRHGSKKPIVLDTKFERLSAIEQFELLDNDLKFKSYSNKLELGLELEKDEQKWFDLHMLKINDVLEKLSAEKDLQQAPVVAEGESVDFYDPVLEQLKNKNFEL